MNNSQNQTKSKVEAETKTGEKKSKILTAKQKKRLEKEAKKAKSLYTQDERYAKIVECKVRLTKLGLFKDYNEDTQTAYKIMDNYVETGNSCNGSLKIEGTKHIFHYLLPQRRINEITTWMTYDENV